MNKNQNRKSILNHISAQKELLNNRLNKAIETNDGETIDILMTLIDEQTKAMRALIQSLKDSGEFYDVVKTKISRTKEFPKQ
jgi:hypothetical protein